MRSAWLALALLALWVVPLAVAEPTVFTVVPLPQGAQGPMRVAVDDAGRVWATLDTSWALLRHDPVTGGAVVVPLALAKAADKDSLWGLQFSGGFAWTASTTALHAVDMATMEARAWPLPVEMTLAGAVFPDDAGGIWVASVTGDVLIRFDPDAEEVSLHPIAATPFGPIEFVRAPNGTVHVTGTYANTHATVDLVTGRVTVAKPALLKGPVGIAHDGAHLWVGEMGGSSVARVDPDTGAVRRFPTTPSPFYPISGPTGILVAPDGAVWFAEHFADRVARLDAEALTLSEHRLSRTPGANVQHIALAPDGRVWLAANGANALGHLELRGGEAPPFDLPREASMPVRGKLRIPVDVPGDVVAASASPLLVATYADGALQLEAKKGAAGEHVVLLASTGTTTLGRFIIVTVEPGAATPAAPLALLAPFIALAALAMRRWRA